MKKFFRKTYVKIIAIFLVPILCISIISGINWYNVRAEESFETVLAQFPESYRPYLIELHNAHPNWTFEPFNTGLDWDTVLLNESVLRRKLVPAAGSGMSLGLADLKEDGVTWSWYQTPTAWKAYDEINGAFNYEKNKWVAFDTGVWNQASKAAISYVMDPRNWLNENYIFMFEQLGFNETHDTVDIINSALQGTFMYDAICPGSDNKTFAQVIYDAAKNAKVSAMHLAVRLVQEKGTGNDKLGKGVSTDDGVNFYPANGNGQTVYYNYFNIGACGNGEAVVLNAGGKEAMDAGWTSPYLAIMGGAVKVNNGYIGIGQDTIYFEMFSVVDPKYYYWKQYAQNLTATLTEGSKINTTYKKAGVFESAFVFRIPVYNNMPENACPYPLAPDGNKYNTANPNTMLSGISASVSTSAGNTMNVNLTPTFNMNTTSYSIVVPYQYTKINIDARAYASTTSIGGNGTYDLAVGNNTINIVSKSEYGTEKIYTVNIYRSEGSTLLTELIPSVSKLNETFDKEKFKYTIYVGDDVKTIKFDYKTESDIAVVKLRGAEDEVSPTEAESEISPTEAESEILSTETESDVSMSEAESAIEALAAAGSIPEITLAEGDTTVYLDVYASAEDVENYSTYQIDVIRYTEVQVDWKELVVKDGMVSNFAVGDKVSSALSKIGIQFGSAAILNKDGQVKDAGALIATGDVLKIYDVYGDEKQSYSIIIYGDVNGDGKIDIYDFAYIRKMIIKNTGLTGAYYVAGDVYPDSNGIDIYDFAVIRRFIIKGTEISQKR